MTRKQPLTGFALVLALTTAAPSFAQPGGSHTHPGHAMPGMDMQAMMDHCVQMRQQMRPNAKMTPDMQRTMAQCDEMDAQMNPPSANAPGARPKTR